MEFTSIIEEQKRFFRSGQTLDVRWRIAALKRLRECICARETEILAALQADLGKSPSEGYLCEVGMVLSELTYLIRHCRGFAKKQPVPTPMAQFCAKSYTLAAPYGNTLIMSPWNYPFLLTVGPLADAIAAGNTAVVKPSAYSPATSRLLADLLGACFERKHVAVVTGGRAENARLLEQKFDFIFFTGSQNVGREVLRRAAEHLTPAVLELGGKSPVIVDETADIPLAARRIVFGKILNCGQTCVAPDYVLCHSSVKDALILELKKQIVAQLGDRPLENPDYGHMINRKHFDRVWDLIDYEKVVCGGVCDPQTLKIAPTVLDNVDWSDRVMGEEIFGPVLPVLRFDSMEAVCDLLNCRPKPLALYLFSRDRRTVDMVTGRIAFGGGCINDTVIHLATPHMGFGGVGESGMGAHHGKAGFDAFSHRKSIVDKKTWIDLPMRYQPYDKFRDKLVRMFLK